MPFFIHAFLMRYPCVSCFVNSKFRSFLGFNHRILGRFTTRFPMPYQSNTNQQYTNVGYSNLIYITYENNIKVVKQPFLKNNGKSMAKQWQLFFLKSEVFCKIVETVAFFSLFLFKQPLAELFIELPIFINLVLYVF